MPQNKSFVFEPTQRDAARYAKALCHPARLKIISLLSKVDASPCVEIVDAIPLAQPTVSQHLDELLKAGIVRKVIFAGVVCYALEQEGWKYAKRKIMDFLEGN